jgi:hypothetical protein
MAEQFIGLTVLVKLKSPPNTELQGLVANVAGQQLTLRDGELFRLPWAESIVSLSIRKFC